MNLENKGHPDYPAETLRFPNQFVLGPRFPDTLDSWQRVRVGDYLCLSAHPGLGVCRAAENGRSLTLIGFALDPHRPELTDPEILSGLLQCFSDRDSLFRGVKHLAGRWVIIAEQGGERWIFNDPVGLRQVFYCASEPATGIWCASQPGMIADILGLKVSPEGREYIDSFEFRTNPQFRWPAASTPYREVFHMLPNHALDLKSGNCERYWPNEPLQEIQEEEGLEKCCAILCGIVKSAAARFELAVGITAGLDSRTVLAASRGEKKVISCVTVREMGFRDDHADIEIPSSFLSKVGLPHDVVKSSILVDDGFLEFFRKNVAVPHPVYAYDTCAIRKYYAEKYGKQLVVITGSASEIARVLLQSEIKIVPGKELAATDLAKLQRMPRSPYVLDSFGKWLAGAGNVFNYDKLDIFEWEQGHGNWLAMCQLEFDIAWKDLLTPFNCRELLETMLAVDPQHRAPPRHEFFRKIIGKLWPELLEIPINPHKEPQEPAGGKINPANSLKTAAIRMAKAPFKLASGILFPGKNG